MIAPLAPISPSISFPESIKICLKGYANFNGRGRRSEFWWFYLLCIIINAVLIGIIFAFITYDCSYGYHYYICVPIISTGGKIYLGFYALFDIAILIPLLAASTRRLHDIGYSGFYNFIWFVPFGIFFLIYLWAVDSKPGANIYGPATKYEAGQTAPLVINNGIQVVQATPQYIPVQGVQPQVVSPQPNAYQGVQPVNQIYQPNDQGQQTFT